MNKIDFTFTDTIAGYVTQPAKDNLFSLTTSDGREFQVKLTAASYAEMIRNLGEPFQDPGAPIESLLTPGRYLFAYGIFYPEGGDHKFEAKRLVVAGQATEEFRFEAQDWWINQIRSLAEFYLKAQFKGGEIDFSNYRTHITLEGQQIESTRQETDTISRMIYGFATAYLMTGDDRYLEVAEKGTLYLREHLSSIDRGKGIAYWYHGVDVKGAHERKILASQFGDDYDAIPMYEQIYALAGPTQTYRVTGDPKILHDIELTLNLFDQYFIDREKGGYFSHVDPVNFDPRSPTLGQDQARKNWNSVGDHAPAYLINLWLATGKDEYADMLAYTADSIEQHFPDYENSPFVQERFFEDWTHDSTWGWQQNRAVVGHNLKIAWNLMRIHHLKPNDRYTTLARKIAEVMPKAGMDRQRGGWYDVVERALEPGEENYRFVWHDRKAWWQQEQGILAYLILAGSLKNDEYHRLARESSAFYNAWFPDTDAGGVYFNVLATGIPYLLGTERLKGSHSMSGYHSFELAYLASVYTNLLLTRQPMDFYFKPQPGGFADNILRVMPDILPPGSVRLEEVWINGERYTDFDADALQVRLPASQESLSVRVRIVPTTVTFDALLDMDGGTAVLTLNGRLDDAAEPLFKVQLDKVVAAQSTRLVLQIRDLAEISNSAVRALVFARQKLGLDTDIYVVGVQPQVQAIFQDVGAWEEVTSVDTYEG